MTDADDSGPFLIDVDLTSAASNLSQRVKSSARMAFDEGKQYAPARRPRPL